MSGKKEEACLHMCVEVMERKLQ